MTNPNKSKVHTFALKGAAALAITALFTAALLFTGCSDGSGGGSGSSSIEGVWRVVSTQKNSEVPETYPETQPGGSTLQPYFCFLEGKVYVAAKIEVAGDPENSGLFKGSPWNKPYAFANSILTIEGQSESFIINVSGNTATATISDSSGTGVITLNRVSSPTVEQIKAAKTAPTP
ncbi:hypothetical protein [Treponema socranskii]|uniref:hypothetical protein n=1 Tax=Treponema socranskii TaxID=53419 RepID=UPI003D8C683C